MNTPRHRRTTLKWVGGGALAILGAALAPIAGPASSAAAATGGEGVVCTTSASNSFVLHAKGGYIQMPDGNSVFMWSYANGNAEFQYPGPVLCIDADPAAPATDTVSITLVNDLPVATSITIPGIPGVSVNGTSGLDIASGSLVPSVAPGSSITYTVKHNSLKPGTYLYESGTNPRLQVQMGLASALIVRPKGKPTQAYDQAWTTFKPGHEYLHILSEIDPDLHYAVENGKADSYNMADYKARYFLINGRSFPDTIAPNHAAHLPNQPYSALVRVQPYNPTTNPYPALIRYLNAGPVTYPFHPHSNHEKQIGADGVVFESASSGTPKDVSIDRYSLVVPPGGTIDAVFSWVDKGIAGDPNGASPYCDQTAPTQCNNNNSSISANGGSDVIVPNEQNRRNGPYWSGSPYLGIRNDLLPSETQYNQCGEYYHVAHSHALFQATNYGVTMGGMLTMVRVDPPDASKCG